MLFKNLSLAGMPSLSSFAAHKSAVLPVARPVGAVQPKPVAARAESQASWLGQAFATWATGGRYLD